MENRSKTSFRFEQIEYSDYFENRLKNNGLIGETLKNVNEIVISKLIADEINDPNLIGKEIVLNHNIDGFLPEKLKIVGITNIKNYNGLYLNYIHKDLFNKPRILNDDVLFRPFNYSSRNFEQDKSLLNQPRPKLINGSEEMVLGSNEAKLDSLLISTELLRLWSEKNSKISIGTEFFIRYFKDLHKTIKLTGVFKSNIPEIRTTQETIDSILTLQVKRKSIYVSTDPDLDTVFKSIESLDKTFDVFYGYNEKRFEIILNYSIVLLILAVVIHIFVSLAIVAFVTLALILVKSKKREIRIMKVLGAKLWQLVYYNFGSFALILVVVLVLFVPLSFVIATVSLNTLLSTSEYVSIYFDRLALWIVLLWSFTFAFFSIIYFITNFIASKLSYRKLKS